MKSWFGIAHAYAGVLGLFSGAKRSVTRARLPLRVHLAIFAALLLIPALLLSVILLREAANERRREAEIRLSQLASDLADDISNELGLSITILQTLSFSAFLKAPDLRALYDQSRALAGEHNTVFLLLTPEGRPLMNTGVPWGTPLGTYSEPETLRRVVETRKPAVTDLFWGHMRKRYVINVLYPVIENGVVTCVLALSITPERIHELLQGQELGPEWTMGVVDTKGVAIARSRHASQYLGKTVIPPIVSSDASSKRAHPATNIEGRRVLRAVSTTRIGNWRVAASISEEYVNFLALGAIRNLVAGSIIVLGLAGLLVALYGRELAASVASITHAMEAGLKDGPKDFMVREASDAADRLQRASKALRDSEERFRSIFQNAATGIALAGLDQRYIACNPAFSRITGYSREEIAGRVFMEIMHPDDRGENFALTQRLLRQEIPHFEIENRYIARDGRHIWVQKHISLTRDGGGLPTGILSLVTDMTERRESERALAISLERSKIAQKTAHAALYEHAPGGELIYGDAFATITGYGPEAAGRLPEGHRALVHPEDAAAARAAIEAGLASGEGYDITYRLQHKTGHYVWVQDRASVLRGGTVAQDRVIGMLLDISEQKAREEHINLLLREVNHRSKNMLGLVQAIARQTVATSPGEFLTRFSERIQALSANQDLLVRNEWGGVDLQELIEAQLAHLANLPSARIVIRGPTLQVSPAAAQVIGMVMHELATNASKYGALSNEAGRIEIAWDVNVAQTFHIVWREADGPAVAPPECSGFGTTVIGTMARMGLEADVTLDYAPGGVVWALSCPLARVIDKSGLHAKPHLPAPAAPPPAPPNAPRVLVVEDEPLIALEVMHLLQAHGFAPLGPARSVEEALAVLANEGCDAAVLDVNLGRETAEPVARALTEKGISFVVVSAYDGSQLPAAMRRGPFLRKPVDTTVLLHELRAGIAELAS